MSLECDRKYYHTIKQLRTDAGRFGHFLPLFSISSAVSGPILTKFDTETPDGSESIRLATSLWTRISIF